MSSERGEGPLQALDVPSIETEPRIVPVVPEEPAYSVRATGCIDVANVLKFDAAIHRDWFCCFDERSGRYVSEQTVVIVFAEFLIRVNALDKSDAGLGRPSGESKRCSTCKSQTHNQRREHLDAPTSRRAFPGVFFGKLKNGADSRGMCFATIVIALIHDGLG